MKKVFSILLVLSICLGLCACFSTENTVQTTEPTVSVDSLYQELVKYATDGNYKDGMTFYVNNPDLKTYKDAEDYYLYCKTMEKSYKEGKLGSTYKQFASMNKILDTEKIMAEIEKKVEHLQGVWKADNGKGSYLYIVIKDGYVFTDLIGYSEENQELSYTDDDFKDEIYEITLDNGTTQLSIKDNYSINYFADTNEIMVIKWADATFDTFNGLYKKID